MKLIVTFLFIVEVLHSSVFGRRHILNLKNDGRSAVLCSHFGFLKDGYLSVSVSKLQGEIHYMTFTLDKAGNMGVASYLGSKPKNCFRDQSFKLLYFSFDPSIKSIAIHNNDTQLKGLIFEAGTVGMDDDTGTILKSTLIDRIEFTLESLRFNLNDKKKMAEAIYNLIQLDSNFLEKIKSVQTKTSHNEQYPLYKLLYEVASDFMHKRNKRSAEDLIKADKTEQLNNKVLESNGTISEHNLKLVEIFTNILASISPSGSLLTIPYQIENNIISFNFTVRFPTESEEGLYSLYFHNCAELSVQSGKRPPVNITLKMVERNPDSYLSVGQQPLPLLYSIMCCAYLLISLIWFIYLRLSKNSVFRIHYLMFAVVFIKALSLAFHGINYYVIGKHGVHEEGWAVMYYITHIIRGALLFITILLIGAGWAFIKHMLTPRERNVFLIVIPLQILANVATIVIEESEAGAARYAAWKEIFIFVDLACCSAILFPVVWSIRHLKAASQTDGKAAVNLRNLRLFRHFYILVICYVYFTRVIVYLMTITVVHPYSWLVELFKESVTLAFFVAVGYKFRPVNDNPYLLVSNEDDDEEVVMERIQLEDVWSQSGFTDGLMKLSRPQTLSKSSSRRPYSLLKDNKVSNHDNSDEV